MVDEELKKKALEFLRQQHYCVLSTFSYEHGPKASTMMYWIDDNFVFYMASNKNTQKVRNIHEYNLVSLVVGCGPDPITIQANGQAEILEDVSEDLFYKLMKELPDNNLNKWPILKLTKTGFVTIKFYPSLMTLLSLDYDKHQDTYHEDFQKVLTPD